MSVVDNFTRVANAQAITSSAVSANSLDLGTVLRDIGRGDTLALHLYVAAAFDAGPTLSVGIILATDEALTTSVLGLTRTYPLSSTALTLGAEFELVVPALSVALLAANGKRYIGADFVVASGPFLTGAITAHIGPRVPFKPRTYASGITGP